MENSVIVISDSEEEQLNEKEDGNVKAYKLYSKSSQSGGENSYINISEDFHDINNNNDILFDPSLETDDEGSSEEISSDDDENKLGSPPITRSEVVITPMNNLAIDKKCILKIHLDSLKQIKDAEMGVIELSSTEDEDDDDTIINVAENVSTISCMYDRQDERKGTQNVFEKGMKRKKCFIKIKKIKSKNHESLASKDSVPTSSNIVSKSRSDDTDLKDRLETGEEGDTTQRSIKGVCDMSASDRCNRSIDSRQKNIAKKYAPVSSNNAFTRARSSFCFAPSTPRVTEFGKRDTRLSVLQSLSKTLSCDSEASFAPEVTCIDSIRSTPLDKLLRVCTSPHVQVFDGIYSPETIEGSTKIGEGAFGEVFLLGAEGNETTVLKIVPIDGNIQVNGQEQTKIEDMLSEVTISEALSKLRSSEPNVTSGFVEYRGCHVFRGAYPPQLLALWDKFNVEHKSENDRPDNLPSTQMYIALEFDNAGKDLEKFTFKHASQALQAWKQVAHSLAVAEEEFQFEHRDLHWGNVLVKETTETFVHFTLGGDVYQVETCGVMTSIIDFSLSRLSLDKVTIYNNLSEDPTLFSARGQNQPGGDYQFDIYRKMKESNNNEWEAFNAKTNIYWLDYMLDKMLTEVHYSSKKTNKLNRSGFSKMRNLRSDLSRFNCVADWVRREGDNVG